MPRQYRLSWLRISMVLLAAVVIIGALLSVSLTSSVYAQGFRQTGTATPTPTDPIWLAFSAVRDALEEEFGVDLTFVQKWEFVQSEWSNIDSCDSDVHIVDARPIYFGWTFRITSLRGAGYEARISFDLENIAICDEVSVAVVAAVSGEPGTDANLPAPVAGAAAGGGFELGGHVLELDATTVQRMQSAGMNWMKKQLTYHRGDGPDLAGGMIAQAHGQGFKILLGIKGEKADLGADFNGYLVDFSAYLGQVAALGADGIEVWNEPNIDREWPVGSIDGANYTQMLASAFNGIKSANPNTLVISGGPAPTGFFGGGCGTGGCDDDVFMQQMAAAGAGQYMDCVGLHYNEGIVSPGTFSGDPRGEYPTYYFSSMLSRGVSPFGGKQACFTELGYLSPEGFDAPLPAAFGWAGDTSLAEHTTWLADAATRAAQSGQVRLMIIWNVNFPFYTATDPMGGYAIMRPDGSCPACASLGAVMGSGG